MKLALVFLCAMFPGGLTDQQIGTVNSMLDPNRITWWRTKWAPAHIQLSISNKGLSSVATFFISPSTSLSHGVLEVTFPIGFAVLSISGQAVSGQVVLLTEQTYVGGQDYAVTVSGLTNPGTEGEYGPFALKTRFNPRGQIVDVNLTFGSVYIFSNAGQLGTLVVDFAGKSINNVINQSGNTLSFQFTIGVSLSRYDSFVIEIDEHWTVTPGMSCNSVDSPGHVNNYNGTDFLNPHALSCLAVGQTVYIYGLAVDIELAGTADNRYANLEVTAVTTPDAVYIGNPYSWRVYTSSFGTNTIRETGTYSGGPVITYDIIKSATWTPTWGMSASDLLYATAYFMDLSFTTANPIPQGGSVQLVVTEDVATGDPNWMSPVNNCFIVTYLDRYTSCVVSAANQITLLALPDVPVGKTITVRNVVRVKSLPGTQARIISIQTYKTHPKDNILIDKGENLALFSVSSSIRIMIAFGLRFQRRTDTLEASVSSNYAGGCGDNTQAFQFTIVPDSISELTDNSTFTITCPFTSGIEDFAIGVQAASFYMRDSPSSQPIDMSAQTAIVWNTPVINSAGTLNFTGVLGRVGGEHLLVYQNNRVSDNFITLPRIVNNLATAYECRISIETSSKHSQRAALRFTISPQDWTDKVFSVPCTNNIDGMPDIFTLKPAVVPVLASYSGVTYFIEVQIKATANFNSGLTTTPVDTPNLEDVFHFSTEYAHDVLGAGNVTSAQIYVIGENNYVAVTDFLQVQVSSDIVLAFPMGGIVSSVLLTPIVRSFYILASDPRVKYITHEGKMNSVIYLQNDSPPEFAVFAAAAGTDTEINDQVHSSGLLIDVVESYCAVCGTGCASCSSATQCDECLDHFILDSETKACNATGEA